MSIEPDTPILPQPSLENSDSEDQVYLEDPANPPASNLTAKSRSFFRELYAVFDVNTFDVSNRMKSVFNPTLKTLLLSNDEESNFDGQVLNGTPDMWGPIWIYFTLVFVLFIALSMPLLLDSQAPPVDLTELTSFAALLGCFVFILPILEWLLAQYLDLMPKLTLLQTLCTAGYTFAVYVPAYLICGSPLGDRQVVGKLFALIIRCICIGFALIASNFMYLVNLYQMRSVSVPKSRTLMFLAGVAVVQSGFAIASVTRAILANSR